MLLSVFWMVGFLVREIVKPLQKLLIPASVIGGTIALILGPQVLNFVTIPDSFSEMPSQMINFVLAAMIFGTALNKEKVKGYLSYTDAIVMTYGLQLALGVFLGIVFRKIWTSLPQGWGIMGLFAFWGGHGTVAAAGSLFEELGIPDNQGLGMILATIGLITSIGAIDAQISLASWRQSLPLYCIPDLTGDRFEATDLIHPLLTDPVPNSISVSKPVLLTGSNASGKSTFLKSAALAAILAQSVNTAPAASYRNCCCRIFTSMALRDDIRSGESYFIVEIRSLKRVLDAAAMPGEVPVLCCVDEVLRGTNTIERISASAEILSSLADMPIRIFAATHDMELTELLDGKYINYHFSEMLDGEDVKFSYKLLDGPADSRNAIRLLRALGYDPGIADRAEARAKHFMETGNWEL